MIPLMIVVFAAGYLAIAMEHSIKLNKASSALITGVLCWVVYVLFNPHSETTGEQLTSHMGELSGILFFIMSAMTIVELIDSHDSFSIITDRITQTNKKKLIWIIGFITFFMSAVLDNLTTTIVLVTLLRKLIRDNHDRLYFAGIVIIAANAGGAWSPIGDVTTTMLWIGGQITAFNIIIKLILPSLACLIVPLAIVTLIVKGNAERSEMQAGKPESVTRKHQKIVLFTGIAALISVPVFKTFTGLPPYMGILLALGIIWIINEILHGSIDEADRHKLSVVHALRKIDTSTILFFLGILLAISALQSSGILEKFSLILMSFAGNESLVAILIGLLSSIIDNVPLVAATQGMFDLTQYPPDHYFWEFLAYTTGTGGSALIIGSAAGVAAMGIEKIDFVWYLKKISWLALIGFFSGAGVYILQDILL